MAAHETLSGDDRLATLAENRASVSGSVPETPETNGGNRFGFGENWSRFLSVLSDERIAEAERSLREMLEVDTLAGISFLDIGCGSGLFSLAAMRLGAERVHSIDFDPVSAACAGELKRRYYSDSAQWTIEAGSVLDPDYVGALGQFDIVYCWGVLHHTGDMFRGLDNVSVPVAPSGRLFLSIYNDQGPRSKVWRMIKRAYNRLPRWLRAPYVVAVMAPRELLAFALSAVRLRPHVYVRMWTDYKRSRGMSRWHDIVDWVGGYPFEVAAPETIFDFYRQRGFSLERLVTATSGCNQFVFRRVSGTDGHH